MSRGSFLLESLSLLLLVGCSNPPVTGPGVASSEEFLIDSYRIRQGKFSILEMEGEEMGALTPDLYEERPTLIADGDVLNLHLYHTARPDLCQEIDRISGSFGFVVQEGKIALPALGEVKVAGMALEEAVKAVRQQITDEIGEGELFMRFRERPSEEVEFIGMVERTRVQLGLKRKLFDVLSEARISPQANLFKSYVSREGKALPVDLYKLVKEGSMEQNIAVRGGDKIYIADLSASSVFVVGEVGKPRALDLPRGFMPLRQALAEAGGLLPTGDQSFIQVARGSITQPKVYTIRWGDVMRLPSESLLLIPGDLVYVAAAPLTQWHRFVTDILPTLIGIDLVTKGIKGIDVGVP